MQELSFIAELSGNHERSLEKALNLVEAASRAGATHVKVQTFTPDSITYKSSSRDYTVSDGHTLWGGQTLWDLYNETHFPLEWHAPLFEASRELGIEPFSSPFDEKSVDFLFDLGVSRIKIASLEIVDLPLIAHAASTKLPLIVSTGTASMQEVEDAVEAAKSGGCVDLTLLVCTSEYPAPPHLANLLRIPVLASRYGCRVGFSDHSLGSHLASASIALGARTIEKHLKLNEESMSPDAAFSATEAEFAELVRHGHEVLSGLGRGDAWDLDGESESRRFRPSIIATKDIASGKSITENDVATLRPNIGLAPKYWDLVIGAVTKVEIKAGTGVAIGDIEVSGGHQVRGY